MGDRRQPTVEQAPAIWARAAARLAKHVEIALDDVELSLPQYRVLALLTAGSAAGSALASKLAVSPPSVTALVDGLVGRGLVERRPDPLDRRRVSHLLTDKGRRALSDADAAVDARLVDIAAHLEPRERARAIAGLQLWYAAMDAYREAKARHG